MELLIRFLKIIIVNKPAQAHYAPAPPETTLNRQLLKISFFMK